MRANPSRNVPGTSSGTTNKVLPAWLGLSGPRQLTDIYLLALSVRREGRFVTFDTGIPLAAVRKATNLSRDDRRIIGNDVATVEYGWPIGKPTCAPLGLGLWEVRSHLTSNRIVRVIFTRHEGRMWLLHGFIKKTQKTPDSDIDIARKRKKEVK